MAKTFGQRLNKAIGDTPRKDIATRSGIPVSGLSALCLGDGDPERAIRRSAARINRLASAIGINPSELCSLINWDEYDNKTPNKEKK